MRKDIDIAIVGGGAAGFFAAIAARYANPGARVTIFERAGKVLAKVEITGGGRCNVTNSFADITDMRQAYPRGHQLMKRLFKMFDHEDTYNWFERHGVELTTQEDECVFPVAQDSHAIINCLVRLAEKQKVTICTHCQLTDISRHDDGRLQLLFNNGTRRMFQRVIITTGGSPHACGLHYLERMGHKIENPVPSLFTFNMTDKKLQELMGTVVDPVAAAIPGTKLRASGALLVTHWGMSGPAVLKLSSRAARWLAENNYRSPMSVAWTGERPRQEVEAEVMRIISENPRKQLVSVRPFGLPTRLWTYLIEKNGFDIHKQWGEIGRKGVNRMLETFINDQYVISGKSTYREEFVTCGGVSLSNLNQHTLESKVCEGLYFAGEVLDVDAITGGFNLQAAWTMGYVAGTAAATDD